MNIIQIFASPVWGGGEQYIYDLAVASTSHRHAVTFFSRKSSVIAQRVAGIDGEYYQLPFKGIIDFYSVIRLSKYLKSHPTDIIHIHCFKEMFTVILAKRISGSKAKIVLTRHLIKKGKNNPLDLWAYRHINRIVFVSRLGEQTFLGSVPGFPKERSIVVHNSIPSYIEPIVKSETLRERFHIAKECPLIVFVGRVVPAKGILQLIAALGKLHHLNFFSVIIGKGQDDFVERLKALVASEGLADKVAFLGHSDKVRALIADADIGVAPSLCQEAFGLTAIEFMQAGKCIVTTDNGAQVEFIKHGSNGWLVAPGDVDALSQALSTLISDSETRNRLGDQAKKYFQEELTYDKFYEAIMRVYSMDV